MKVAVIGAGDRGSLYAELTSIQSDEFEVVAVAEPIKERREKFVKQHGITNAFHSWEEMLEAKIACDVMFVATQDRQHFHPTIAALDAGYHVLVEKPLSPDFDECIQMVKKAKESNKLLMLCYVLRYTPFFQQIKNMIDERKIGDVTHISIDMDVAYWHQAHSFVRGNWRNSLETSPMLLAKSCHDMDILTFLLRQSPIAISSFGALTHFREENAPEGASLRCTDDCKAEPDCPFSAIKIYLGENTDWPVHTISTDTSYESRKHAIETGPYGRCVYHCDNDVVDHQTVNLYYEDRMTATIMMNAFTKKLTRQVRVLGTKGELYGDMNANELILKAFDFEKDDEKIEITLPQHGLHAGGDYSLLIHMAEHIRNYDQLDLDDYYHDLLQSHYLVKLAEQSRLTTQTVEVKPFSLV